MEEVIIDRSDYSKRVRLKWTLVVCTKILFLSRGVASNRHLNFFVIIGIAKIKIYVILHLSTPSGADNKRSDLNEK